MTDPANHREDDAPELSPATLSVWAGEGESLVQGATQVPVVYSAAYGYPDVDAWLDVALGRKPGHIYSRNTNPTVRAFEEKMRDPRRRRRRDQLLDRYGRHQQHASSPCSRPATASSRSRTRYGGTNRVFLDFLPRFGIEVELCDTTDHEQIEAAVAKGCRCSTSRRRPTRRSRSSTSPASQPPAHAAGAPCVVDNTFATPLNQSPLALGADLVLHSATKYLGGHADVLGGAICGARELVEKVYHYREITGAALDPMAAYLLIRSMKTLALRVGGRTRAPCASRSGSRRSRP